jgi:N-acetylglucosaminyldiphosphoundecaprenol N-acetyl-beta-D-mannosaminyltransferase
MLTEFKFCKNKEDFHKKVYHFLKKETKGYCSVVNPNILYNCYKNSDYFNIIKLSAINVCDSISVQLLNNLTENRPIKAYPGPDLFKKITKETKKSQFFIGGESNAFLVNLRESIKNPSLSDLDFVCPPFADVDEFDYIGISKLINARRPEIIWIGLGAPKQEIFMSKILPFIDKGLMIGVGAAFNFYSGYKNYKRAPKFIRKLKLEWLFRLISEPKKMLPRVLRNTIFLPMLYFKLIIKKYV